MIIIGDVHGDWNGISYQIRKFNIKKTNFIQVGDFGIGFSRNDTDNLKKETAPAIQTNTNIQVFIRGLLWSCGVVVAVGSAIFIILKFVK